MQKQVKKFLKMIATTPVGTALKIGAGAGAVWLLNNVASLNLSPAVATLVVAGLTIAINYLNPQDPRYGNGANNGTAD
jgi:hypothetical protein